MTPTAEPLGVELRGVGCSYGSRPVVHDVDLVVEPGRKVALTGANGSGKSTLLRALLGLHPTDRGATLVGGRAATSPGQWRQRRKDVAWMPQRLTPGRFPMLVGEVLDSSGAQDAAADAAGELGVGGLGHRALHTLSGGQLQRVFLARALGCVAAGAGLLVADEPSAALDFDGQEQIAKLLASLPVTVLVVSHDRAVSAACDVVAEMAAGRLRVI